MLNLAKHRAMMVTLLREIYSQASIRNCLGFKGGTAAMLFYKLPRMSVDLDFDLLDENKKEEVFKAMGNLLPSWGKLAEAYDKRYTLFFLVNYGVGERNIKIEISKRKKESSYELRQMLGIPMLVMTQRDMATNKLLALIFRKNLATRDIFDMWFMMKNQWEINPNLIFSREGLTYEEALKQAEMKVMGVKQVQLLSGLGELLDQSQKDWVRVKLIEETLFYLRLYRQELGMVA